MTRSFAPRIFILCVLATVAGCGEKSTAPTILPARAQPYVFDVPVPQDFELDVQRSTHDRSPGKRQVHHFYLGDDKPITVKSFYLQKMPENGWELLSDELRNGVFVMKFKNAEEKAEVRVENIPRRNGKRTQVSVEIQRQY